MKRLYAILGALSALAGACCLPFRTVRIGAALFWPLALCCGLMVLFLTLRDSNHPRAPLFRALAVLGHLVFGLWLVSLIAVQWLIWSNGLRADESAQDADYLLVLGAGIDGDQPGKTLACRLETARQMLEANPDQLAVLCGGQGFDEIVPESTVMKNWLIAHGISPDRLIEENRSRNTVQNIQNAKALMDERSPAGYRTAVLTSNFHLFRAKHLMERAGLDACGVPAPMPNAAYTVIFSFREYFSLIKQFICGW
ncbi:MAG: YdcF family protein [Butyricicoccaceae bacterium]